MIPSSDNGIARKIADLFTECSVEGLVSFDQINLAAGMDTLERRYLIERARTIFHKETGGIMSSVRGEGYTRLASSQFGDAMSARRQRGRRHAQKTFREFSKAMDAANDMDQKERLRVSRELAVAGYVAYMQRDDVVKKIIPGDKPPSYADTARRTMAMWNGGADPTSQKTA